MHKYRGEFTSGGPVSDLRTATGGRWRVVEGFACRGLAEGLTSELTSE